MAGMVLKKPWDTVAKALVGVGALNIGLVEFLGFDVLGFVPEGMITKVVVGAIGVSGLYVLSLLYNKKI